MLQFASEHPFIFIFALFIIAAFLVAMIKNIFDFIVELVHGKPVIQNLQIPIDRIEEVKDLSKQKPDKEVKKRDANDNGFDSKLKMDIGKVEVFRKDNK